MGLGREGTPFPIIFNRLAAQPRYQKRGLAKGKSSFLVPRRGFEPRAKQATYRVRLRGRSASLKSASRLGYPGFAYSTKQKEAVVHKRNSCRSKYIKSLFSGPHKRPAWDGLGKGGDSLPNDLQLTRGAAAITKREDMLLHVLSFGASSGIRTPGEAGR